MEIYVIVTNWNDVLYKLDGWSRNMYLARTYYNKRKKQFPGVESEFITYDCNNSLELAKKLKMEFDSSIDDILDNELNLISSRDSRLCMIYKSKYKDLLNVDDSRIKTLFSTVSETFLASAPLVRYLDEGRIGFDLLGLLFLASYYNMTTMVGDFVDIVYLWYFILRTRYTNCIIDSTDSIPLDSVFIRVE